MPARTGEFPVLLWQVVWQLAWAAVRPAPEYRVKAARSNLAISGEVMQAAEGRRRP